jgi:hypothetical protein
MSCQSHIQSQGVLRLPKILPTQNCAIVSTNARTHARIAQPKKTRHTQVKNDKQPLQQEKQRECRNPLLPVFISPVPRKSGMLVSNLASTKRPNVARRSLPTSKKRQTTRFICTTFRTRARRYTRCFWTCIEFSFSETSSRKIMFTWDGGKQRVVLYMPTHAMPWYETRNSIQVGGAIETILRTGTPRNSIRWGGLSIEPCNCRYHGRYQVRDRDIATKTSCCTKKPAASVFIEWGLTVAVKYHWWLALPRFQGLVRLLNYLGSTTAPNGR